MNDKAAFSEGEMRVVDSFFGMGFEVGVYDSPISPKENIARMAFGG